MSAPKRDANTAFGPHAESSVAARPRAEDPPISAARFPSHVALRWGPPEMDPAAEADTTMIDIAMQTWQSIDPSGSDRAVCAQSCCGENVDCAARRAIAHTHGGLMVPRALRMSKSTSQAASHLMNTFI